MTEEESKGGQYASSIVAAVVFHPLTYFKTLAQLGHEPLDSYLEPSYIFRSQTSYYPNAFQYLRYIREEDGFLGMYRGLGPRILHDLVCSVTTAKTASILESYEKKQIIEDDDPELDAWKKLFFNTTLESASHAVGIVVSYPFHVLMVRSMAQFIGKEHIYDNSFNSISEIYNSEGIRGFFLGLVPRLLGEMLTMWIAKTLVFVYRRYVQTKLDEENQYAPGISSAACSLVASFLTYPLFPVSTVMAVNGTKMVAGVEPLGRKVFSDWRECYSHLGQHGALKRGNGYIYRLRLE